GGRDHADHPGPEPSAGAGRPDVVEVVAGDEDHPDSDERGDGEEPGTDCGDREVRCRHDGDEHGHDEVLACSGAHGVGAAFVSSYAGDSAAGWVSRVVWSNVICRAAAWVPHTSSSLSRS